MKKAIAVLFMIVCAALALAGCDGGRNEKNTTKMTTAATTKQTTVQTTSVTTRETTSESTSGAATTSDTELMPTDVPETSMTSDLIPDGLIPDVTTGGSESDGPVESNGSMGSGN